MEETIKKLCEYIEKAGTMNLDATDIDYLYKVVDIYKDLKEVESMNNYGNYGEYNRSYGEYNEYGRRGVDSRYRAGKYMDGMRGSYEAYEDARNEYNRGNYGAKEDGLKESRGHNLLKDEIGEDYIGMTMRQVQPVQDELYIRSLKK